MALTSLFSSSTFAQCGGTSVVPVYTYETDMYEPIFEWIYVTDYETWECDEVTGGTCTLTEWGHWEQDLIGYNITISIELEVANQVPDATYEIYVVWNDGSAQSVGGGTSASLYFQQVEGYIVGAYAIQTEPSPAVTGVRAEDPAHSTRYAENGGTLHLVGHNDVTISASGQFPAGCPSWSTGQTGALFTDSSSSDQTYSAGGYSVTVVRHQATSQSVDLHIFDQVAQKWNNIADRLKFGSGPALSATFSPGSSNLKMTMVEKYNNPDYGYKKEATLGATGSLTGRIVYPPLSWYFGNLAACELYASASVGFRSFGGMGLDPSTADGFTSQNPSITATGAIQVGFYLFLNTTFVQATATGSGGTGVSVSAQAVGADLQWKCGWDGVIFQGNVKLYRDPNDPWIDWTGSVNAWDGADTGWSTFLNLESL